MKLGVKLKRMVTVKILNDFPEQIEDFFSNAETHFIYPSKNYLNMLSSILNDKSILWHICVYDDGILVGYLPLFIYQNKKYGNVANSLPYFGSNGSILTTANIDKRKKFEIKKNLLNSYDKFCEEQDCIFSCIITSPFEETIKELIKWYKKDYLDFRIGQIIPLKKYSDEKELRKNISHGAIYSYKKGRKNCTILDLTKDDIDEINEIHKKHMESISGTMKDKTFFEEIFRRNNFKVKGIYHLDKLIAFIVFIFYRNTVNYYTLGYLEKNLKVEGTAYAIYQTILESLNQGYEYFDFGGTWNSQSNIYNFKKKYATDNFIYYYFIKEIKKNNIAELTNDEILKEYPYYYILPFDKVKSL